MINIYGVLWIKKFKRNQCRVINFDLRNFHVHSLK